MLHACRPCKTLFKGRGEGLKYLRSGRVERKSAWGTFFNQVCGFGCGYRGQSEPRVSSVVRARPQCQRGLGWKHVSKLTYLFFSYERNPTKQQRVLPLKCKIFVLSNVIYFSPLSHVQPKYAKSYKGVQLRTFAIKCVVFD